MKESMKFNLPHDDSKGSLNSTETNRDNIPIENKKLYLSEGVEKWSQTIKDYWANYVANKEIEATAKASPEKQMDYLLERFNQGINDTHHRLASNINSIKSILNETGFFTSEQIGVLQKIIENSKEDGKIKRYKNVEHPRPHPICEVYEKILSTNKVLPEELEDLKKDAYDAGVSTAVSDTVDEVMSWFYWAGGAKYIQEGKRIPISILRLRKGNIELSSIRTGEEEKRLLSDGLLHSTVLESGKTTTPEEIGRNRSISDVATQDWGRLYFSDNFQLHPSFLEYIEKPLT